MNYKKAAEETIKQWQSVKSASNRLQKAYHPESIRNFERAMRLDSVALLKTMEKEKTLKLFAISCEAYLDKKKNCSELLNDFHHGMELLKHKMNEFIKADECSLMDAAINKAKQSGMCDAELVIEKIMSELMKRC